MTVDKNSAMVAEIAYSYVKNPRLAFKEFQAIVYGFRELYSEFTKRVADAYHLNLDDRVHASGELTVQSDSRDTTYAAEFADEWDSVYQQIVDAIPQQEKKQLRRQARVAASKHCKPRAVQIASQGDLFCRAIDSVVMVKDNPLELVDTVCLKTIVCQDRFRVGHPVWWSRVFKPNFKYVDANFRVFSDRLAFLDLKTPTGAWPDADRDAISQSLSGQILKLFNVLWGSDTWTSYKTLKSNRADHLWRGQPDPNLINDSTVFEALRKLQRAMTELSTPYSLSVNDANKRVRIVPPGKSPA